MVVPFIVLDIENNTDTDVGFQLKEILRKCFFLIKYEFPTFF